MRYVSENGLNLHKMRGFMDCRAKTRLRSFFACNDRKMASFGMEFMNFYVNLGENLKNLRKIWRRKNLKNSQEIKRLKNLKRTKKIRNLKKIKMKEFKKFEKHKEFKKLKG